MGMANTFSRPGYSAYEFFGLSGCFSHMTHEQLVNWILCAAMLCGAIRRPAWLTRELSIFKDGLDSMLNRDHPDPAQRNGVMGLDSSRRWAERKLRPMTASTFSLGQARNNIYLAGKCSALYLAMERIFLAEGLTERSRTAAQQARKLPLRLWPM